MALAYADHSVARTHASADQNVARMRCESTQLQGCIVCTCVMFVDTCSRKTLYMMAMLHACDIYDRVLTESIYSHARPKQRRRQYVNSHTAWQTWNYTCTASGYTKRAFKTGSRCQNAKIASARFCCLQAAKIWNKITLHTSDSTLHTSHFLLLPSHSKPHTSHFTLRSSHSKVKLHTLHFSLLTSHCFLQAAHFTLL